ncbi:hypothetical protein Leryth_000513 [Lithospermum erythrorhizon]|nr:hypothetical protein Leryth_000513 [Lithospermum erythrorhizon]
MQLVGMETKFAKVLDSGMLGNVDLKRRRTDNGESYFSGAAGMAVPLLSALNSLPHPLVKRQKLDGPGSKCSSFSFNLGKSLQRYYLNFKNSGPPQRIMYSENGVWVDLPHDVVALIKKEMQTKTAVMEVNIDGDLFLLDFLHMIRMHLDTGVQQPIAWIDEAGSCYFPEIFTDDNFNDCSRYELGSDNDHLVTEHHGSHDLKLKLEIEISGSDIFNLKESTGESNAIAAHVKVSRKSAEGRFDAEDVISSVRENEHFVEDCEESKRMVDVPKKIVPKVEHLDADAVKKMFSRGIGSFVGGEIVALHCGSSAVAEGRRELFQKQVDIVKRLRGDANVHYAWLPFPKGAVDSAMNYGLGCHMTSNIMSSYGIGVHLIPVSCTNISETLFDVDENGMGNVLLCRVIMGTMEHVHPASKQFHPSSDDYDSGVDDRQNPKQYIVWSMNMNTHIYPEYAVSFKIPSDSKGLLNGNRMDVSGVTNCSQVVHAQVQLDSLHLT